jgi:prespore-specific regulator
MGLANPISVEDLSISNVIKYLRELEVHFKQLTTQNKALEQENKELKEQYSNLEKEYKCLEKEASRHEVANEDYKPLIDILDRARKLALPDETQSVQQFKMAPNGNLEKIG